MNEQPPNATPSDADDAQPILSKERVLQLLQSGEVETEHGRLRWSSNYTFLISVCDDEHQAMAIYKPQRGERPLWDFPDGTLCYRERAAFLVSDAIGWDIVPPTVLRDGSHGLGSFQLYIEHNPEVTYFNFDDSFKDQMMRFAAFDYITNNADRKGGHCLLDENGKVWGIDHGICFHVAPKLRTVIWDYATQTVPDDILADVAALCEQIDTEENPLRQNISQLISPKELASFQRRVHRLLETKKFPEPGYGPSYPWPPV